MKQFFILLSFFAILNSYSQAYMDKIVQNSCDCVSEISDTLNQDQFNFDFGICLINAAMPFKKELLKNHEINMDNIDFEGEKLGRLIALQMASTCPRILARLTGSVDSDEETSEEEALYYEGVITKIEKETFVVFTMKEETGKSTKFYWLTFIDSNIDVAENYESLLGKKVELTYDFYEFYDARINEYRNFNLIEYLNIPEE